jgi:hypothetical protein
MEAVVPAKAQKKEEVKAEKIEEKEEKPEVTLEAEEETGDEDEEEEEKEDKGLSEDELDESRRLYLALKDPKAGPALIAALAQQAGLFRETIETKKDAKEVKKSTIELLKEGLGKDYEWLADKIGPAIEKVVAQEKEEQQQQMQNLHLQNVEREVSSELAALARETKGESKKLEARMVELMDDLPSSPNVSVKKYIRHLYTIASAGKTKQVTQKEVADKIRRNAGDAPSRLHATSNVKESDLPKGKMNINQAVAWALEHETKREGH